MTQSIAHDIARRTAKLLIEEIKAKYPDQLTRLSYRDIGNGRTYEVQIKVRGDWFVVATYHCPP